MTKVIARRHSALYWCNEHIRNDLPGERLVTPPVFDAPSGPEWEEAVELLVHNGMPLPIDVLVDDTDKRRRNSNVSVSCLSVPLPPDSFVSLGYSLAVCCPELSFVQAAEALDATGLPALEKLVRLIDYGYEICGVYSQRVSRGWSRVQNLFGNKISQSDWQYDSPDALAAQYDPSLEAMHDSPRRSSPAVCVVNQLEGYLNKAQRMAGLRIARKAARYVIGNSASPMETQLAMMLTLPPRYGGYGFERSQLNYRIGLTEDEQKVLHKQHVLADICWPDKGLILEYDGHEEHEGRITEDNKRDVILNGKGYTVLRIRRGQLDVDNAHAIARVVAKKLGCRNKAVNNPPENQVELLRILRKIRTPH